MNAALIPSTFLFRYALPVQHVPRIPRRSGRLFALGDDCKLPRLQPASEEPDWGEIRLGWNAAGLAISARVGCKRMPPSCNPARLELSDGLRVWIDTRNTQNIHRASRFCHSFCFLPSGAGAKRDSPLAVQSPILHAREEAKRAAADELGITSAVTANGYRLEAWLAADVLTGYDPEASPRLGFFYHLRDSELGDQFLTLGPEFPFAHDPSLWSTLELMPRELE